MPKQHGKAKSTAAPILPVADTAEFPVYVGTQHLWFLAKGAFSRDLALTEPICRLLEVSDSARESIDAAIHGLLDKVRSMEQLNTVEQTESREVYEIAGFPEETALLLASAEAIFRENLDADAAELLMKLLRHSRQFEYLPLLKRTELQYFPAAGAAAPVPPHISVITTFYDPDGELLSAQNFTVLEESNANALDEYGVLDYTLDLSAIQQQFFGRAE